MHETCVDFSVKANTTVWRVVCEQCGLAVDDLEVDDADRVARVLARRMCGSVVGGHSQGRQPFGGVVVVLSDEEVLAAWTGGGAEWR
jgi:hypothetical protein